MAAEIDWPLTLNLSGAIVGALTLVAVVAYTRAAFAQAEGFLKPCLTPDFDPFRVEPNLNPDGYDDVFAMALRSSGGTLLLRNIGTGPAVNVRYKLVKLEGTELPRMEDAGPATPVGPGRAFDTRLSQSKLDDATRFRIQYDSLTGKRYESEGVIENGKVVAYLNFRRVWWGSAWKWRRRERRTAASQRDEKENPRP